MTEKAELESEKTKLVEDVTANKKKTKDLEDNLLYRLTSTQVCLSSLLPRLSLAVNAMISR